MKREAFGQKEDAHCFVESWISATRSVLTIIRVGAVPSRGENLLAACWIIGYTMTCIGHGFGQNPVKSLLKRFVPMSHSEIFRPQNSFIRYLAEDFHLTFFHLDLHSISDRTDNRGPWVTLPATYHLRGYRAPAARFLLARRPPASTTTAATTPFRYVISVPPRGGFSVFVQACSTEGES